jgi:hypothetical protein
MPRFPATLPRRELLSLYRRMLRLAQRFPSVKRETLIEDIRLEWRAQAAGRGGPAVVARAIEVALRGEGTLSKYAGLDSSRRQWKLDLEQDPLGMHDQPAADADAGEAPAETGAGFQSFGSATVQKLE